MILRFFAAIFKRKFDIINIKRDDAYVKRRRVCLMSCGEGPPGI
jgi:hypothetical protein